MSHTPQAIANMIANDPSIRTVKKVPVGTIVVYYGRSGSMRQGRTKFPAVVLHQHPDDGSIDLIVWFEAEDIIWEQRVRPYDEATNPGHSWVHVDKDDIDDVDKALDAISTTIVGLNGAVANLQRQMYGEYNAPARSMIEYLDDFDKRLKRLERTVHNSG